MRGSGAYEKLIQLFLLMVFPYVELMTLSREVLTGCCVVRTLWDTCPGPTLGQGLPRPLTASMQP